MTEFFKGNIFKGVLCILSLGVIAYFTQIYSETKYLAAIPGAYLFYLFIIGSIGAYKNLTRSDEED